MADNNSLIHDGQVVDVNHDAQAVRVAFDDMGNATTGWLQINFPPIGRWIMTSTPRIGDQVKVLRNPNGMQEGLVIGSPFTAERMPQNAAEGILQIYSDNGKNYIRLDAENGVIEMRFDKSAILRFSDVSIEVENNIDISCKNMHITGDVTHTGDMVTSGRHTDINGRHV